MRLSSARASDESGIALVMALGIVLVLTVVLGTVLAFTAAGSRDSSRNEASQQAKALAEAGLNTGLAHLAAQYPSAKKAGNSNGSIAGGPVAYDRGTFSWTGTFDAATEVWDVAATATVQNPTGPGAADIVRTASAKIGIQLAAPWSLFGLYAASPAPNGYECTRIAGSTSINVPIYVASCLELAGNLGSPPAPAKVYEPNDPPTVSVHVGGADADNDGDIDGIIRQGVTPAVGTAADPVKVISAPSCGAAPSPCSNAAPHFYATSYPALQPLLQPKVDAQLEYDKALWSAATCSSGSQPFDNDAVRNNSKGTFDLLALGSFSNCRALSPAGAQVGRLSWDATNKVLDIAGTIYLDGNLFIGTSSAARYTGDGTIYVNGTVDVKGIICGPGSTFVISPPSCDMQWDPALGSMLIVAANTLAPQTAGTPIRRYSDPESDGAANSWTKSSGTQGWSLVDEGTRQPGTPTADQVSSVTNLQQQDVVFENLTHDATATYTIWIYARKGNRRGLDTQISKNDSTFGTTVSHFGTGTCPCAGAWYSRPVTIASQAELDGLRLRLITTGTNMGSPTAVEVHEVYLEQSVPTLTVDCADDVGDASRIAFNLSSSSTRLETGAWAVGTFASTGQAQLGGSVFTEGCSAIIEGGGELKAFISLPSGAPTLYALADRATDFR